MASNSNVFAKMGNPWMSEKEAVKDYGRNPASETPDLDRYLHAKKPKADEPKVKTVRVREKSALADPTTRIMNIRRAAQRERNRLERQKCIVIKASGIVDNPTDGEDDV